MSKRQQLAKFLSRIGGTRAFDLLWGQDRLTVLAYHRIDDYKSPDFCGYAPIVSASPQLFEREMAFVEQHFNVIDLDELQAFILDGEPLPPKPLLITFDDGYLDNYQHAFPILQRYGLPAVIFLVTDSMDHPMKALWWDECAMYFHRTSKVSADLPLLGEREFGLESQRKTVIKDTITQLKTLPEADKQQTLKQIANVLDVVPNEDTQFFINWDQVRELVAGGIACQPHTTTHPILTRISNDETLRQLEESKMQIVAQTGQSAFAFAYPNGFPGDYDESTMNSLLELGYTMAFTLEPGPMRAEAVRKNPLQIKRVYLGHRDTFEIFKMKIMGIPALLSRVPLTKG
jgi:peptidoglycan/xylan/chitin deacetylase (PgdA/CDA1 family)